VRETGKDLVPLLCHHTAELDLIMINAWVLGFSDYIAKCLCDMYIIMIAGILLFFTWFKGQVWS